MAEVCGPDVVNRQVGIAGFRLRPDGREIAYVRRHAEGDAYRTHIWSVSVEGGEARQLTRGKVRDSAPAYSPDGRSLAFVRTVEGADHAQAWILPLDGGEPWALPELKHGVSSLHWSPDGRRLAAVAASDERPFIVGTEEKGKAPRARRITRLDWRDDEDGHRDRRSHLFLLEPRPDAEPRQLTSGNWDVVHPAWAPDSRLIAFATDARDDRDLDPRTSIWVVEIEGGAPAREHVALDGDCDFPSFAPDGRLAFLGRDLPDAMEYEPMQPWIVPADGGDPRLVQFESDGLIGTWAWSELDLVYGSPGPFWLDDQTMVVLLSRRARTVPHSIEVAGGVPQPLIADDRVIASALDVAAGTVAFSATVDGRAGEVYVAHDGRMRRLTTDGSAWQEAYALPRLDEFEVPGPAGPINTWIASPPEAGEGPLPTILHFHGGPTGSFGPGSSLDAMLLTAAGYRVVMPNIRGSAGFGRDWAHALNGRWGEADEEDALAVTDWLVEQGLADPERIGIYGLSYGGYLVQWLVGVTDRYFAAVGENGVANQVSTWANCFFGVYWDRRGGLGDTLSPEGVEKLWSSSPLKNVARIRTPLLILQAEDDRVCPAADNEQLFTALRAMGRETEYILYPEEHHEMKVYGRPDRRIDRHERMLDWFARHLPTDAPGA
ncbi:MAG TPA: S9 family peptidase [Candidatus Limnocylindrales bacterium]|nr:S9 family peptidase [Candidatus Limnocylindrales bacterium]